MVIERIENLKCIVEKNHRENTTEHNSIMSRQDHTNGDVTGLKLWKAYLLGAWVVVTFVSTVILPVLGYYFMKSVKTDIQNDTENMINKSISANNDKFFEITNED